MQKRRGSYQVPQYRRGAGYSRSGASYIRIPGPVPFPDIYECQFVFNYNLTLTGGSPLYFGEHYFSMNSLFDPNFTGVGVQPYYLDQLLGDPGSASRPYGVYCVRASRIEVVACPVPSNSRPCSFYLIPVNSFIQDLPSTAPYLLEMPDSQSRVMNTGAAQEPVKLEKYMTVAETDNMPRDAFIGDMNDYRAAGNSSPTRNPLWGLIITNTDYSLNLTSIVLQVKITYYSQLFLRGGNIAPS